MQPFVWAGWASRDLVTPTPLTSCGTGLGGPLSFGGVFVCSVMLRGSRRFGWNAPVLCKQQHLQRESGVAELVEEILSLCEGWGVTS